jgi:hypothetical protein
MSRFITVSLMLALSFTCAATLDEHKGKRTELGKQEIAGYTVAVTQIGEPKAGGELSYEIVVTGGAGKPKAVRAWYGIESAEGSTKAKAVETEKFWDADLELPAKLPDKSACWIEIETADGKKKASFPASNK